jgi:hypothetical protein
MVTARQLQLVAENDVSLVGGVGLNTAEALDPSLLDYLVGAIVRRHQLINRGRVLKALRSVERAETGLYYQ